MKNLYAANLYSQSHMLYFHPLNRNIRFCSDETMPPIYYDKVPPAVDVQGSTVTLRFYSPTASHVRLIADGLSDSPIPMEKQTDGNWKTVLLSVMPGFYYHEYEVDGNICVNPEAPIGYDSFRLKNYFEISDTNLYTEDTPHGSVRLELFPSSRTGHLHACWLYVPYSYDNTNLSPPALLMSSRGGESETAWFQQGKLNFVADELLSKKQVPGALIVMGAELSDGLLQDCASFLCSKYRINSIFTVRDYSQSPPDWPTRRSWLRSLLSRLFESPGNLVDIMEVHPFVPSYSEAQNNNPDYTDNSSIYLNQSNKICALAFSLKHILLPCRQDFLEGVEITDAQNVIFHIQAPKASRVQIAGIGGAMGRTRHDLSQDHTGTWSVSISGITPGFHYCEFYVDGNLVLNPSMPIGYGAFKAINFFEMPDRYSPFYQIHNVRHGTVRMEYYFSSISGYLRNCLVYTPPGYEQSTDERYPVWYLQHGGGENETGWIWQGKLAFMMDNLISTGQCRKMIVVMNEGYAFPDTLSYDQGCSAFPDVLVHDCIPFIDRTFRTKTDSGNRALSGLSMGGIQTMLTAFSHPDCFSYLGMFSVSLRLQIGDIDFSPLFSSPESFNQYFRLALFCSGDQETDLTQTNYEKISMLSAKGYHCAQFVTPGYHEWTVWRFCACEFAKRLFQN